MKLKFIRTKPIGSVETTQGLLFLFPDLRPDDYLKVSHGIEQLSSKDYVQILFRHLCHYQEHLPEDKSMPLKPSLSKDDINLLTYDELNELASIYLENDDHDGNETKKDNETDIEYIHRLAIAQKKRLQEASDEAMGKYAGIFTISDEVTEQINDSLLASKALQKSTYHMDDIGQAARKHKNLPTLASPIPNTSLEIKKELQKLVAVSNQASDFAIKSHQAQLSINDAIVSSGKETSNLAQKGIRLTIAVIFITILIPVITIFFTEPSNQKFIDEKTSLIINKLDSINLNLNQTTVENKKFSSLLKTQDNLTKKLLKKNKIQEKTIADLKHRIEEIEEKI